MRIARALSVLGICSRRAAERLVTEGRVQIDGQRASDLSTLVDPLSARILVDGKKVEAQPPSYTALNKPRGVVSTVQDPHASRTVMEMVSSSSRVYPVGRLDKDSEGLMILTNDGDLANVVMHPRYGTEKEYLALVQRKPTVEALQRLRGGVSLEGEQTAPAVVEIDHRSPEGCWLSLTLREGKKREVRRMLAAVGHPVIRLIRIRIGPVHLDGLPSGHSRPLTTAEVEALRRPTRAGL